MHERWGKLSRWRVTGLGCRGPRPVIHGSLALKIFKLFTTIGGAGSPVANSIVDLDNMSACIDCRFIDLIGLWTTKSPRLHKPSFLELVFSAENCLSCEIILKSLPIPPVAGLPLPTLLAPSAPLLVVTVNGYKYARTVIDSPINIDSLIFYFDDLWNMQDLDNIQGKADPKYFHSCLDVFAGE